MSKYVIRKVNTGVKFDLYAPNGQTIVTSEVYDTAAACRKGIESVRRNAPKAGIEDMTGAVGKPLPNPKFEVYQDRAGAYRFRLRSRNGKIIAISDDYTAKASCLGGIESVKRNAAAAQIEM